MHKKPEKGVIRKEGGEVTAINPIFQPNPNPIFKLFIVFLFVIPIPRDPNPIFFFFSVKKKKIGKSLFLFYPFMHLYWEWTVVTHNQRNNPRCLDSNPYKTPGLTRMPLCCFLIMKTKVVWINENINFLLLSAGVSGVKGLKSQQTSIQLELNSKIS